MKIAMFTDSYLPTWDGVVTSLIQTRRELEKLGHEVIVFAPGKIGSYGFDDDDPQLFLFPSVLYPGYRMYRSAVFPARFRHVLNGIDLVHSHGAGFVGMRAVWAKYRSRIPMVFTFHTMVHDALLKYGPPFLPKAQLDRLLQTYLSWYFRRCDVVIFPTSTARAEIMERYRAHVRKSITIPNGVDLNRFTSSQDNHAIRRRLNLAGNPLILCLGRVAKEKNLDVVIKSMKYVEQKLGDARLLIAGRGPSENHYRELTRRMSLENKVILDFSVLSPEEVPLYYRACDVFATASTFETQGVAILEAMASGKPVAAAASKAIPELVEDNLNGVLFDYLDPRDCAAAIVEAYENRNVLGPNARRKAESFSSETCCRKLLEVYEDIR